MKDRYWTLEFANESNRIKEAREATGLNVDGLVDEVAGGVIGYIVRDEAPAIVAQLNRVEHGLGAGAID